MSEIVHEDIHTGTLRLHVARVGALDQNRELIIFLHGFPESWASWRKYLGALGEAYLAIAPDNRGFNRSDCPVGVEQYEMNHIVSDIHALAMHYGNSKFTLIGHDWGGMAAWHFAARYPEMLKQLVVLNAPHPAVFQKVLYANQAQRTAAQYISRLRDPDCEARLESMGIEQFWISLFGEQFRLGYISNEDKQNALRAWQRPGALTAMLNWYRASSLYVPADGAVADTETAVSVQGFEIFTPTLVIWGMQDTLLLPCLLDDLDQYVAQLNIARIDDAGHGLIHEIPDRIIAIIREWMSAT